MTLQIIRQVLQSDPELRNGMMHVLMARLNDSYTRLNMVKKMKTRCQVRLNGRVFRCIVYAWILACRFRQRWTSPRHPARSTSSTSARSCGSTRGTSGCAGRR